MSYDLVTFGETMIRLSPPDNKQLEQAEQIDVHASGSELNVAVAAQRLGLQMPYVTRLTRNPLGRMVENKAREYGVDTSHIVWSNEDRVGLYFVEFGASPRANSVLYDRKDSAIARIKSREVAKALPEGFSLEALAITLRETPSVWKNRWSMIAYPNSKNPSRGRV